MAWDWLKKIYMNDGQDIPILGKLDLPILKALNF